MIEQISQEITTLEGVTVEQQLSPSVSEPPTLTAKELAEGRISFLWTKYFETPPTRRLSVTSQLSAYLDELELHDERTFHYVMDPQETIGGKMLNITQLLKLEVEKFNRARITRR